MEDYDLFGEMQDLKNKKTIIIIEDDECFILKKFINSNFEIIPIRYSYDLSCFSDDYINKSKKLILENSSLCIVDETNDNNSYKEKWFSVANFDVSKGNALNILTNYLNVSVENTIAIGNGKNDVSMFKTCGFSVAVDNASESIKKNVDYITLTNDKDGVAAFLESLII